MRSIFLLFTCLFSLGLTAQKKKSKTADPLAGIDAQMEQVLKDRKGAGFAVAVVYKDSIIFAKGYGYRDLEKKSPVTPETQFAIGSCTKSFTSALIGWLNQDGKLEYDKPVRDYLPELVFYNDELNRYVTLRDMMCHRTGLPRHDYSWYLFKSNSRDSLLRRVKFQEPTIGNRQAWQYNNFMFLAQGVLVEKLTKKTWENNIREKFFKPLGMNRSNLSIKEMSKDSNASLGYMVVKDSLIQKRDYYEIGAMGPAGSINSSVMDMGKWLITWINGGKYKGVEILPESYVREAISSQMIMAAGLPDKEFPDVQFSTYGFGWMMMSYRGHYRVEHGGNIDGFSASTCFFPSDSLGIVVLSNQNGSSIPPLVRNLIADRFLKLPPIDYNQKMNESEEKARNAAREAAGKREDDRVSGTKPSHAPEAYSGLFRHEGYGTLEVSLKKDSLVASMPNGDFWLKHHHYDVYKAFYKKAGEPVDTTQTDETILVQYQMDVHGDISGLSLALEPTLQPLLFARTSKPASYTEEELKEFAGEYEFAPGQSAKFYTKGKGVLYLFVEGQPEYELTPQEKNTFKLKIAEGYSCKFEANGEGKVQSVTFIQPNGKFKATKKK